MKVAIGITFLLFFVFGAVILWDILFGTHDVFFINNLYTL